MMAQQQLLVTNTVEKAWTEFQETYGKDGWIAEWNPVTKTPTAIYGRGIQLQLQQIESEAAASQLAARTLDRFANLLGRGQSRFVEDIAAKMGQLHIFVYKQYYRGIEVVGGRADRAGRTDDGGCPSQDAGGVRGRRTASALREGVRERGDQAGGGPRGSTMVGGGRDVGGGHHRCFGDEAHSRQRLVRGSLGA